MMWIIHFHTAYIRHCIFQKSAPLLQDVNIFKETRNSVAKPSEVHTGLTDYESSDDESLTSSGKEVCNTIEYLCR